jgi:hypothetical protein
MLDKVLDRLTPKARAYVDSVLNIAGEFTIELNRGSKNRGGSYNSEETGMNLTTSHKFPLAALSDATFVLGWVQDVLLLCRLYGGVQISPVIYQEERDQLLARMESISAAINGYEKPDLTHLKQSLSKVVDLDQEATKSGDVLEGTIVDIDATPYAGGYDDGTVQNGGFTHGPFDKISEAMDQINPDPGLFIWKLDDPATKAAEPSEDCSQWVIL